MTGDTHLELYSWLCNSSEGRSLPVGLFRLFPHHHVERGRVLVAENKASVIVVRHRVHVERSFEVDPAERFVACRWTRETHSSTDSRTCG